MKTISFQITEDNLNTLVDMFVARLAEKVHNNTNPGNIPGESKTGLLTRAEAAKYLGISRTEFYRQEKETRIKKVQVTPGKKGARFKISELDKFIEQRSQAKDQTKDH